MSFSLIVATKGRVSEVRNLLASLAAQSYQDFEVIISDQNGDDRLVELLREFDWGHRLTHLRNDRGLSRGRNLGLEIARGDIVCFPDDDCTYPPPLLEQVDQFFANQADYGFLSGRSVTEDGQDAVSRHARHASSIERATVHSQCIEFALFIRRSSLGDLRFDENMGVGAATPWHSDEGPDLVLRLKEEGIRGYYDPQYTVQHPKPVTVYDAKAIDRAYRYACGNGYFLRKHGFPISELWYTTARSLCAILLAGICLQGGKASFYWARTRGRWRGWQGFRSDSTLQSPQGL